MASAATTWPADCARKIRDCKIIYTSGYSAEIAGKDFRCRKAVNFLPKPFTPVDLARVVRKSLDEPVSNHIEPSA